MNKTPLYVTIETDGYFATITSHGPSYITNSKTVKADEVDSVIEKMRRDLLSRELIIKAFDAD